jgi:hypothetical protein
MVGTREVEDPRDVVRYWRLVELFSPQRIPELDPVSTDRPIVTWPRTGRLPWNVLAAPTKETHTWSHTVFLGVYELECLYEYLHQAFPQDRDAYDERPGGLSACAALVVDGEGRLVGGTAVLSSAAWGVGQIAAGRMADRVWLDGFMAAQERFAQDLDEAVAEARLTRGVAEGESFLVDDDLIDELVSAAWRAADLDERLAVATRVVHLSSIQVRKDRAGDVTAQDFLNSFFLDDLGSVADAPWGSALKAYLTPADRLRLDERVDVRSDPHAVIASVGIDRVPSGRWPSDPAHPLATSQQFAVNQAAHDLGAGGGLLGVNGPPGTGKTTLLRDVFASNVVRRASVLASLRTPDDAFGQAEHRWKSGGHPRRVKKLRDDLVGYEMLVASSNNAAVENVTLELPRSEAVHGSWMTEVDHFTDLATALSGDEGRRRRSEASPAWALVAARLGKASNRNRFRSTFWFGMGDQGQPHEPSKGVVHGLQQLLKDWERDPHTRPDWQKATAAFHQAARRVESLRAERQDAFQRIVRSRDVMLERADAERETWALKQQLGALDAQIGDATLAQGSAARVVDRLSAARDRHLEAKPGLWETLTSMGGATRAWRSELVRLNGALAEAELTRESCAAASDDLERTGSRTAHGIADNALRLDELDLEARELADQMRGDRERFGRTYPGAEWLDDDVERELNAPWQDPEFNRARSDLLIRALEVHKAFLANAADMSRTMRACLEVVVGAAPRNLDPDARRAAWQLFFLAVPLVSTTFASVARMLHGLPGEALGWLFVDEAGQATPQAAVGAIWRSRRVLAVGDPMQLQPVVTVPRRAQQAMALHLDVSDTWVPSVSSVQILADRVARYGTVLPLGVDNVWVSSPLRVHRRCDSPMFEISNTIAYDNLMIRGTQRRPEVFAGVPPSRWIDVPATSPGSHLQRSEIETLHAELSELVAAGIPVDQMIAISPFKVIARELERLAAHWPGLKAGTIHTAQGREAPVVFLVLGGDPAKPGARQWAAETPNLLNVAASRAQRRLYVIGDRERWRHLPYFRVAELLLAEEHQQADGTAGPRKHPR